MTLGALTCGLLHRPAFVNHEDAVFAKYYFEAYDTWAAGRTRQVPEVWRIALNAAKKRKVTGSGNLLLGISAHINRVTEPLLAEAAARSDPTMDDINTQYAYAPLGSSAERDAFCEAQQ